MTMRLDLTWLDDDAITYQASCADCSFQSMVHEEEEAARAAWDNHLCA
jgi:hypothetical protein